MTSMAVMSFSRRMRTVILSALMSAYRFSFSSLSWPRFELFEGSVGVVLLAEEHRRTDDAYALSSVEVAHPNAVPDALGDHLL